MQRIRSIAPLLTSVAGVVATAYGGYGAGVVQAAGARGTQWLEVAAVAAVGLAMVGTGFWTSRRSGCEKPASFATEITLLERLVPTVSKHAEGISALQELLDIVFKAHLPPAAAKTAATLFERRSKGGRSDV